MVDGDCIQRWELAALGAMAVAYVGPAACAIRSWFPRDRDHVAAAQAAAREVREQERFARKARALVLARASLQVLVLARGDVTGPLSGADSLALVDGEAGVPRVVENPLNEPRRYRSRSLVNAPGRGGPTFVVCAGLSGLAWLRV